MARWLHDDEGVSWSVTAYVETGDGYTGIADGIDPPTALCFISAADGASVMQNIDALGSMQDWLTAAEQLRRRPPRPASRPPWPA